MDININYKIIENKDNFPNQLYNLSLQYKLLLILIIAAAVFIRVWQFGSVPGGINQDEAMAAVDGYALGAYGTDRYGMLLPVHLTAWGYGQMSSLLSYMIAPLTWIFGLNVWSARLPLLIVSLISLYVIYMFAFRCTNANFALIALFLTAISPWHIMQSRWSLDCNLFPHFLLFASYCLYLGISKNNKFLYLSMFLFGLSMYCYGIAIYTVPLLLIVLALYFLAKKFITIKQLFICVFIYLLIGGPFILCMIINFFKLKTISLPFMTIPYFEHSIRSNDILFFSENFFKQLLANFKSAFDLTILQKADSMPWNSISGYGIVYPISIPFVLIGIILLLKNASTNKGLFIITMLLITAVFEGLITNNVNINRFNIMWYPIIICASLGVYFCTKKFKSSGIIIFIILLISFGFFSKIYFTTHNDKISHCFMQGFGKVMTYAKEELQAEKYVVTDHVQLPGTRDVTEILIQYYHSIPADFYQSDTFNETYNIVSYPYDIIYPQEGTVYIVNDADKPYLDENEFLFVYQADNFAIYEAAN